jgi:hypothetical protein
MSVIILPVSFHTSRTIPLSDLCKNLQYVQLKNMKQGLVQISYDIYNEKDTLQTGTAIITPSLCNISLSPLVKNPYHAYTVLRLNASTPVANTEEPYELELVLRIGKN